MDVPRLQGSTTQPLDTKEGQEYAQFDAKNT